MIEQNELPPIACLRSPAMPEKRSRLQTGYRYEFVCLQIDIAGHSKLADAERILHAAKKRFYKQIKGIVATYGGQRFKWEGDGGAFLFQTTDGREFDEAVYAAFRILESLPSINDEIRQTTELGETLAVRISLDSGQAVYDLDPGLITGDFLNAFLKNERAISHVDTVTITERVSRQISVTLRERFIKQKHSDEVGCDIYRSKGPEATVSASRPVPSNEDSDAEPRNSYRKASGPPLVDSSSTSDTAAVGQRFWTVPYKRNPFFAGRDAVITSIRQRLTQRPVLAQAITGLGGMGKTQIAVEYVYRYRDTYQAVFWINAESTLDVKTGYDKLARLMRLPHGENDLNQAVLAFKRWLASEAGWLLVFDNADEPATLKPFLPDTEHGHVLLTSRAQDFQDLGIIDPLELEQLQVEEATAFLLYRCQCQDADVPEREAATQLASELGGLPLALEQAAAYIVERRTTFQRYLASYRSRGLRLVEARGPAFGGYVKTVATTWAANFEAVQEGSPAAADVLRLSAFLAPDEIPFELLTGGASELGPDVQDALRGADNDPLLVNDLLQPLGRFSLISFDRGNATYTIHRLVQEVVRAEMDNATRRLWVERAFRAVSRSFPAVEYYNWPLCGQLLPHALAVTSWIVSESIKVFDDGSLTYVISRFLGQRGQYAEAEPFCLRAIELCRAAHGERDPDYATSLSNLASLYRVMGRYAEARPLYLQATEIRRTAQGNQHPHYAISLCDLAGLYQTMGRFAEAEVLYLQATEIIRTSVGDRDPLYAGWLNNLGRLYLRLCRFAEAEPLFRQAIEICRATVGDEHPQYASSLNNLAVLYVTMRRFDEAEPLCLEATKVCRRALGDQHPDYAASLGNLASLYQATDRNAEAEPLFKQVMEISRVTVGDEHRD